MQFNTTHIKTLTPVFSRKLRRTALSEVSLDTTGTIVRKRSLRSLRREILLLRVSKDLSYTPELIQEFGDYEFTARYYSTEMKLTKSELLKHYLKTQEQLRFRIKMLQLPSFSELLSETRDGIVEIASEEATLSALMCQLQRIFNLADPMIEGYQDLDYGVCHGDLHEGNVICAKDSPVFIDWEDCFLGPRYLGCSAFFKTLADYHLYLSEQAKPHHFRLIFTCEILFLAIANFWYIRDFLNFNQLKLFTDQFSANVENTLNKLYCQAVVLINVR